MERIIKRGDIYYAELNPVIGSEQGGTRPVLIISNDIGNKHSPTVIIAAITSRVHTKAKLPTHTAVSNYEGLDKDSVILLEQIRTIDKQRLKQYMGMMPNSIMPMFIRDYTDDEATIIMVDSNIQREDILPSEKARAYHFFCGKKMMPICFAFPVADWEKIFRVPYGSKNQTVFFWMRDRR